MSDGHGVIAGNAAGKWVRDGGERNHKNAKERCSEGDDNPRGIPGWCKHHGEKSRHEENMVTGKKHVAHWRKAGEQQRNHKA